MNRYGILNCGGEVVDHILANGVANLMGTSVINDTIVNGTLKAENTQLNSVTVNGAAIIKDAEITARAEINGSLSAIKSNFLGAIYLGSNSSCLEACNTKDIFINSRSHTENELHLFATKVDGSIFFKKKSGTVFLCQGSTVSGQVSGGEVIEGC